MHERHCGTSGFQEHRLLGYRVPIIDVPSYRCKMRTAMIPPDGM